MRRRKPVPRGFAKVHVTSEQAEWLDRTAMEIFRDVQYQPFQQALGVVLLTGMAWAVELMDAEK